MNPRTDNERLLDDVLGGDNAALRDALLGQTLRLVRRRRRFRQTARAAIGLALSLGLMLLFWRVLPPRAGGPPPRKGYALVQTRPLPAAGVIVTHPLPPSYFVAPDAHVVIVSTEPGRHRFREIDDRELLALAPGPAALVRQGPHSAELVFISPTDEESLWSN